MDVKALTKTKCQGSITPDGDNINMYDSSMLIEAKNKVEYVEIKTKAGTIKIAERSDGFIINASAEIDMHMSNALFDLLNFNKGVSNSSNATIIGYNFDEV